MDWVITGFAVYGIVLIVTMSELFKAPRRWFRMLVVALGWEKFFARDAEGKPILGDDSANQEVTGYDFITCAMCTGVWIAGITCLLPMGLQYMLAAYGLSYFLRTLER